VLLLSLLSYFFSTQTVRKLNLSLVINDKDAAIPRSKLTWLLVSPLSKFCSSSSARKLIISLVINDKDAAVARLYLTCYFFLSFRISVPLNQSVS